MGNTLIVTTGNTELVSDLVGGVMRKKGFCVTVKNVTDTGVGELGGRFMLSDGLNLPTQNRENSFFPCQAGYL